MFAKMKDMPDLYCTCQEFLDLGQGDYEEHAILLCNYFKYIDNIKNKGVFNSYIVYGEAMPMGNTVYVMRKMIQPRVNTEVKGTNKYAAFDYGGVELWAPMTGECYYFKLIQNNDSVLGI
jgi:coiled-coil and C2 domain-containing protein 2A